ncbi:MAG: DUF4091 domain-containing protein [Clostridia bacterium]|nr:DUF4091 domain-containing protein [Clostridia bacterium]
MMMIIKLLPSLSKVFPDDADLGNDIGGISCFTNEPAGFTLAVRTGRPGTVSVYSDCDNLDIYRIGSVYAGKTANEDHDDWFENEAVSGMYPDILYKDNTAETDGSGWLSFYMEFNPRRNAEPGKRYIGLRVYIGGERISRRVPVTVFPAALPAQKLVYTNWFHSDCLSSYYKTPVFSDRYFDICADFMRVSAAHGSNMILTPLFTPPLDTEIGAERPTVQLVGVTKSGDNYGFDFSRLDKWIAMAKDCGMKYFEMSHLFTQWGARCAPKIMAIEDGVERRIFGWETDASGTEYTDFLRQFSAPIKHYIESNGLHDKIAFHTSDEPGDDDFGSYAKASALVSELFGEYKRIDALSDFEYYKRGLIDTPVPFIGSAPAFAGNVPELWLYYCGSPCREYMPNRLLAMPLTRARAIGIILYKYNAKGFLHWGYNFYYTQGSKREVDPFRETDAGGHFPAGDSFVVYPGQDGKAMPSLRLKAFYEGIRDYEALKSLEDRMPREEIIRMLEDSFGGVITERNYPREAGWYLQTAEKVRGLFL